MVSLCCTAGKSSVSSRRQENSASRFLDYQWQPLDSAVDGGTGAAAFSSRPKPEFGRNLDQQEIGRADKHERVLSLSNLAAIIDSGRHLNPDLRVKINTVVNALNFIEDMSQPIRQLAPDKWKVLRMLPTITSDTAIADHEFAEFVARHRQPSGIMASGRQQ